MYFFQTHYFIQVLKVRMLQTLPVVRLFLLKNQCLIKHVDSQSTTIKWSTDTKVFFHLQQSSFKMRKVIISNAVIKGYHEFQIRPPPLLCLQVTKEYGNKHDKNACLVWVPELRVHTTGDVEYSNRCQKGRSCENYSRTTNWTGTSRIVILFLGAFEFSWRCFNWMVRWECSWDRGQGSLHSTSN